jgi:hypothetical protein
MLFTYIFNSDLMGIRTKKKRRFPITCTFHIAIYFIFHVTAFHITCTFQIIHSIHSYSYNEYLYTVYLRILYIYFIFIYYIFIYTIYIFHIYIYVCYCIVHMLHLGAESSVTIAIHAFSDSYLYLYILLHMY